MNTTAAPVLATIHSMITAPAESAPADELIACIAARELNNGRAGVVAVDVTATYPALGMALQATCVPSKSQRVIRAVSELADINAEMIAASITESDAAAKVATLLARIDRNSKIMDVAPEVRLKSEELGTALDEIAHDLEVMSEMDVRERAETSDGRYLVSPADLTIHPADTIPGYIAAVMPRMDVTMSDTGAPELTITRVTAPAGREDIEAAEFAAATALRAEIEGILGCGTVSLDMIDAMYTMGEGK